MGSTGGIVRHRSDATNLAAELAVLTQRMGMDGARARSSIYARALTLRDRTTLPLEELTSSLLREVTNRLAQAALRGQRPSLDQTIDEAAQSICGPAKLPD